MNDACFVARCSKTKRGITAKVRPPQLGGRKVGRLSTRTPHRPNPIGLSVAEVESVDVRRRTLHLRGIDLVDGTPVLDVKPYVT